MAHLPIDGYREQILELIDLNDVIIITSSTGSGKTTRVPKYIVDHYGHNSRVVVTQPRRIAAVGAAQRVAQENNSILGKDLVGYQISLDKQWSRNTKIVYVTAGTLVEILTNQKDESSFNFIIVDECHTSDLYTDELLLQIKMIQTNCPSWKAKIILMSATICVDTLHTYFGHKTVGTLQVDGNPIHRIDTFFIDDVSDHDDEMKIKIFGLDDPNPKDVLCNNLSKLVPLIKQLWKLERHEATLGSVLVFVPGVCEINSIVKLLGDDSSLIVLPPHANSSDEETMSVFKSYENSKRKIIIATNVAESSITIRDVRFVVDFCLQKINTFENKTFFSKLKLIIASQQQCIQRTGRTGRTGRGFSFRLVSKAFWEKMDVQSIAEMKYSCLDLIFLRMKKLNLERPKEMLKQAFNAPSDTNIDYSVLSLKLNGALTILDEEGKYVKEDGEITIIGNMMMALGLTPKQARLIVFGRLFGLLEEAIVIASSFSVKSLFVSFPDGNYKKVIQSFINKKKLGGDLKMDALSILGAYHLFLNSTKMNEKERSELFKTNFIKSSQIVELNFIVNKCKRKLQSRFGLTFNRKMFSIDEIMLDNNLLIKFQVLMAFSSFPNIFSHCRENDQLEHVEYINGKMGNNDVHSTLLLQAPFDTKEPNSLQMKELEKQFFFQDDKPNQSPQIKWKKEVLSLNYVDDIRNPDTNNASDSFYSSLKFKACNKNFGWMFSGRERKNENAKFSIELIGPKTFVDLKFVSHLHGIYNEQVEVDRDSVNQFLLDAKFPLGNSCSVASMHIMQKKNIVLKECTFLSENVGFYCTLYMLLGHRVQMFFKNSTDCYATILSGLGVDPQSGGIIFPTMESSFDLDYEYKIDDIEEINNLRKKLSSLLSFDTFISNTAMCQVKRDSFFRHLKRFLFKTRNERKSTYISTKLWEEDLTRYNAWEMFPPIKTITQD